MDKGTSTFRGQSGGSDRDDLPYMANSINGQNVIHDIPLRVKKYIILCYSKWIIEIASCYNLVNRERGD